MKLIVLVLSLLLPFVVSANKQEDAELAAFASALKQYAATVAKTKYELQQAGKYCSIIVTRPNDDFPPIGTFDCQRLAADVVLDHELAENILGLLNEHANNKLSDEEVIRKMYIFMSLRDAANQALDKKHGESK